MAFKNKISSKYKVRKEKREEVTLWLHFHDLNAKNAPPGRELQASR